MGRLTIFKWKQIKQGKKWDKIHIVVLINFLIDAFTVPSLNLQHMLKKTMNLPFVFNYWSVCHCKRLIKSFDTVNAFLKMKYILQCLFYFIFSLFNLFWFRHHEFYTLVVRNCSIVNELFMRQSKPGFSNATLKQRIGSISSASVRWSFGLLQRLRLCETVCTFEQTGNVCFASQHPNVNALEQFASLTLNLHTERKKLNMDWREAKKQLLHDWNYPSSSPLQPSRLTREFAETQTVAITINNKMRHKHGQKATDETG